MESTIFTPNVLTQISRFIKSELCDDRIPDFNIGDIYIFEKLMQDAENGQTDFDISIDTDDIVKDSDAYEDYIILDCRCKGIKKSQKYIH